MGLSRAILRLALLALIGSAALVRLAASWNDLWIDEIWTIKLASGLHSPLEAFTLRHDNNHVLNTLWAFALRALDIDGLYRLPAWAAGVATVALGAWVARLGDGDGQDDGASPDLRALVAALLLGGAYLLVHYGSEARGYSLCLAFGLLALGIVLRDGLDPRSRRAPLAWGALVLAMLGHALAIHLLLALVVWSALRLARRRGWRDACVGLVWWYALPLAAYAAFYFTLLRAMQVGGGPREGALAPLARAVAATTGLPAQAPGPLLLGVGLGVLAAGLGWLVARRSDLWAFYLVGIAVSPAALALLHPTDLYAERYFIVSASLWLLLAARLLAWLWTRGPGGALVVAGVCAAFVAGNVVPLSGLVRYGRGAFRAPLEYMARQTTGDTVTLTSDHDFRIRMIVDYYAPRIGTAKRFRYVDRPALSVPGPEWYVAHERLLGAVPPVVVDLRRNAYELATSFPAGPFHGMAWRVYRRRPG